MSKSTLNLDQFPWMGLSNSMVFTETVKISIFHLRHFGQYFVPWSNAGRSPRSSALPACSSTGNGDTMLAGTMRAPFAALGAATRQGFAANRVLSASAAQKRCMSSKPPTAIVMMNMGGPSTQEEVHPFLYNLFTDRQILQMPMQSMLGSWYEPLRAPVPIGSPHLQCYLRFAPNVDERPGRIARRRSPKIREQYAAIGGGSPIGKWTKVQGKMMEKHMDAMSPETAPHKAYTAFRYAAPMTEECVAEMKVACLLSPNAHVRRIPDWFGQTFCRGGKESRSDKALCSRRETRRFMRRTSPCRTRACACVVTNVKKMNVTNVNITNVK